MQQAMNQDERTASAQLALDFAVEALADVESNGATQEEVLRLCDEVISRRLRLRMCVLAGGAPAPAAVMRQMARDRELLRQLPNALDRGAAL